MAQRLLRAGHDICHARFLRRSFDNLPSDPGTARAFGASTCARSGHCAGLALWRPLLLPAPCHCIPHHNATHCPGLINRPTAGSAGSSRSPTCRPPLMAAGSWAFNRRRCPASRCCVPMAGPAMGSCPRRRPWRTAAPEACPLTLRAVGVLASSWPTPSQHIPKNSFQFL